MLVLVILILILPTVVVGGIYSHWVWSLLSVHNQFQTYLGNDAAFTSLIQASVTVVIAVLLFRAVKDKLTGRVGSEVVIFITIWAITALVFMNPLLMLGADFIFRRLP